VSSQEDGQVETVLGPVSLDKLGRTLMHEHVVLIDFDVARNYPETWEPQAVLPAAREELAGLARHDVRTIVDMTVIGLGRDVGLVREIAKGTGLNVIVATGLYSFDELPRYFRNRIPGNGRADILAEFFVRDISEGIADTGIRAAIIKCVTGENGVTPGVDRAIRAAAWAHRATGAPLSTHSDAKTFRGREQQQILRQEGVDLSRVVIGHSGDTTDLSYLTELLDNGSYLGMDRFGLGSPVTEGQRIETVANLIEKGYADKLVLSHDTSAFTHTFDPSLRAVKMPSWRYSYIPEFVVPKLLHRGISPYDIDQMLVRNPRSIFAKADPY
jgi:phosphotriesterase-related protein